MGDKPVLSQEENVVTADKLVLSRKQNTGDKPVLSQEENMVSWLQQISIITNRKANISVHNPSEMYQ